MQKLFLLIFILLTSGVSFAAEEITAYHLSTTNGLPDNDIRYIDSDSKGFLYLTSKYYTWQYDGYSYRLMNDSVFRHYQTKSRSTKKDAEGWMADNRGNRYKVSDGMVVYRERHTDQTYSFNVYDERVAALVNSLKVFVVTDRKGRIWASVNGNGVFIYDKKTAAVRHLCAADNNSVIDYDMIVAIHEDRNGDIWVSQEHYGIVRLRCERQMVSVTFLDGERHSPTYSNVRMMQKQEDGTYLIANNTGRVMLADGAMRTFTPLKVPDENYLSACRDAEGRLWLGARQHGVLIEGRWFSGGRVDCIYRDNRGRMWICGITNDLKILKYDNGTVTERTVISGIAPRFMYEDSRGMVWLCANTGLYIFRPDELSDDKSRIRKVTSTPTRTAFEDSRHKMWIGTENKGLLIGSPDSRDETQFRILSSADGLPNNVVQGILETRDGTVCITTEDGCAIVDAKGKDVLRTIYFDNEMRRNFYNERCIAGLTDGRTALGSLDGIVIVDTRGTSLRQAGGTNLPVSITGMTINGIQTYEMTEDCPFNGDISDVREMTLKHNQNSITLFFSDFSYGDRMQTDYSYRMIGLDETWSTPSEYNFATFRNLKPGRYVFQVRHRRRGGEWITDEQLLAVTVLPPFWATWWAMMLYGIAATVIGLIVYRNARTMYRLRRDVEVERQLTEYKLRFFTNISHEFRTPLTIIKGAMERMRAQEVPGDMKMPLSNIQRSVGRMSRLINQLLEFRKMQNGKLSLALQETEIVGFVRDIWETFADVAEEKHISRSFVTQEKTMQVFADRSSLDKIVHNLLSNAFKYTPDGGTVTLSIKHDKETLWLVVTDTGVGISPEKKKELFSRFVTGKVSADSIGIGLNLTWELVRTHHGTIIHEDNPVGGCIFTVSLPMDKSVYAEEDFMRETSVLIASGATTQETERRYQEMAPPPMNDVRVLVAEDDTDVALLLRSVLGRYFIVDVAHDGVEAWERLQGPTDYRLLLTDVMMPRMNGYELIRKMRQDGRCSRIPIIMLTALESDEERAKALEEGVSAFIGKPFNTEVLVAQCVNLLNRVRENTSKAQSPADNKAAVKPAGVPKLITEEKDRMFLRQLDNIIMERIGDAMLDVDTLSSLFGMSKTPFNKRVKTLTGETPAAYVRNIRLQRAHDILVAPDNTMNVQQVATSVGFNNSQHFSVAFKNKFGVSPKQCM